MFTITIYLTNKSNDSVNQVLQFEIPLNLTIFNILKGVLSNKKNKAVFDRLLYKSCCALVPRYAAWYEGRYSTGRPWDSLVAQYSFTKKAR